MKKIRNIVLAGAMATTLTACGGGGGGAGTAIKNFVQDDLSNLAGSESIINSYSNLFWIHIVVYIYFTKNIKKTFLGKIDRKSV